MFTIVDTEGAEQITLRRVAERAGVSVGRVQHYFPSRDDLVLAAFTAITERGARQVEDALPRHPDGDPPAEVVRAVVGELIPRTSEERRMFRIMQAFETYALTRPRLADRIKQDYDGLITLLALLLHQHHGDRDAADSAFVPQARELLALTTGLAGLTIVGTITPRQAHDIALRRLDAILDDRSRPDGGG
ncbi:TetR family transcriptional regulator C-terminal domain-containing protein [Amycolatopsis sp. NPDC051102]|uniref:TetR/AcrR family transcriptional regulator n=1 Tax=Amycolatopsis sp. NPDC051102 TaxID=3155163 RepID=UPI003418F6F8